jgi:hypothetical protein
VNQTTQPTTDGSKTFGAVNPALALLFNVVVIASVLCVLSMMLILLFEFPILRDPLLTSADCLGI